MAMISSAPNTLSGIIYSCYLESNWSGEHFIETHGLVYLVSGSLQIFEGNKTRIFHQGDVVLYRKNHLAKFVKEPPTGGCFRAITVVLDQEALQNLYQEDDHHGNGVYPNKEAVLYLKPNLLIQHYFKSLLPYTDAEIPDALMQLKKQEALLLLLKEYPELQHVLFDFNQPGKIDLEAFMNQNFKFNVELKRLAYLTGRSLATFKRDFEKIFHTSPNRWLQQKRLEEAYYLIKEKGKKPSDVYLEVGFESISHFSYSFKQFFGVNPSTV